MAKQTTTHITDDFDGSKADETVHFSLDHKSYEIDLNKKNAAALRKAFKPYVEAGRSTTGRRKVSSGKTQFSKLNNEEKERFRKWANLPTARRIGDKQVVEWVKAGKP